MARFCIYTKKTPAQSLRECFTLQHNTYEKHISSKSAAKVRKFYFITKISHKIIDFVKSTLQNNKICI